MEIVLWRDGSATEVLKKLLVNPGVVRDEVSTRWEFSPYIMITACNSYVPVTMHTEMYLSITCYEADIMSL